MLEKLKSIPIFKAPPETMMNLAMNENQYTRWQELLHTSLSEVILHTNMSKYGTSSHDLLLKRYSQYLNVEPTQLLPAAGSDTLIPLVVSALCQETVLSLDPDFFRYRQVTQILNRTHVQVKYSSHVKQEIIQTLNDQKIEMLILSNPNNPLGITHSREMLIEILEQTHSYVIVDEAYAEFSNESVVDLVNKYERLIVLRTLSKGWGLAGLRLGFAVSNPKMIEYLKAVQGPFVLSDIVSNIAAVVLNEKQIMQSHVDRIIETRESFQTFLQNEMGLQTTQSQGNFVYVFMSDPIQFKTVLANNHIAVSSFIDGVRITIGTTEQMNLLKQILLTNKEFIMGEK